MGFRLDDSPQQGFGLHVVLSHAVSPNQGELFRTGFVHRLNLERVTLKKGNLLVKTARTFQVNLVSILFEKLPPGRKPMQRSFNAKQRPRQL